MSQPTLQETVVTFDELAAKRMGRIRRYLRTHPRLVVIGAVVIYLLLTLPGVLVVAAMPESNATGLLVVTLAVSAALLYRRRAPMTVIILVFLFECLALVIAGPQGGLGGVGMIIALYTVATSYSAKRTIPLSILAGSFQTVLMVLMGFPDMTGMEFDPQDGIDETIFTRVIIAVSGSFIIGFYIAAAAVGMNVRNARIHEAELNHWASQVSVLAQVQERNRIAREMHDVVAHSLSVMIALSEGARVVAKRDQARADEVLNELSGTGRAALADMRRMLGVLRQEESGELAPQPTGGNVEQLLEGFRTAGLPVTYTHAGDPLPEDTTFQLTVFRIIQESLTNSLRYARNVSDVQVRLEQRRGELRMEIMDNGDATRVPSVGSGRGLRGMRERAALFGGTVDAGPVASGGWIVKAVLQLPECSLQNKSRKAVKE
ncbi:signal transduction histidine kinase [Glutamicibacter mysorens]|uniref:histidine kinase n=1 Tax=Glutamicibacter mysorens TaxID=257984 RepID=A0ABX4N1E0_9MICC|nr:sensor histidine kinase [Glutamicibacter mysorens]PJJ45466.1 signal transduction histidine kinase [Glutamicibacter mysorens]